MQGAYFIAVDWGTTHFRAYCVDTSGNVLAQQASAQGACRLKQSDFPHVLQQHIAAWQLKQRLPILISGMAGSSIGWRDVGYLDCPCDLTELARHCVCVDAALPAWIVPGLRGHTPAGDIDVMRGEETQILGYSSLQAKTDQQMLLLPGTHSKWVSLVNARVKTFATAITGELYSLLRQHSILAFDETQQATDDAAFGMGVQTAEQPYLLQQLFNVRAQLLHQQLEPAYCGAYLSGLLIGSEIKQMRGLFASQLESTAEVIVIASQHLLHAYRQALALHHLSCQVVAAETATLNGLLQIAKILL